VIGAAVALVVVGAFLLIYAMSPVSLRRVKPGAQYHVANRARRLPYLELPTKPIYFLKPRILGGLHAVAKFTDTLLGRAEIDYWVTCGTLLGAVRHAGFIPWDDEVDINIRLEDVARLIALEPEIRAAGFRLCPSRGGFKIGHQNWLTAYPYVDVIVVALREGKLCPCYPLGPDGECSFEVAEQWPGECLPEEMVYPLTRVEIEDLHLSGPGKTVEAVEFMYGSMARVQVPQGGYPWIPWIDNHYTDNIAFRSGLIPG